MAAATKTATDQFAPEWRTRFAALRRVPQFLRIVWSTQPAFCAAIVVMRLARAGLPVAMLWIAKLIVDGVVAVASGSVPEQLERVWWLVGAELALVVLGELLSRASMVFETLVADLFGNVMSARIITHAATLDLAQFENAAFYDQLERARQQTTARVGLFVQVLETVQDLLTLVFLSGALVAYEPALFALLLAAVLPTVIAESHLAAIGYSFLFRWTPQRRELDYLRYIGAGDTAAKEVRLFGLGRWLVSRHRALAERYYRENKELVVRRASVGMALSLVVTLAYYGAYALIVGRALEGLISIGLLTFLAGSFARGRDLLRRVIALLTSAAEQALYLQDLFAFLEMRPRVTSKPRARPVARAPQHGFVFEGVGFRYPDSERWVVRDLDLTLAVGERLALVGENGAGKTTVVKLLSRLYDPTEGRILLDGVDLRDYDLESLRATVGVIFQDFVRYDMRVHENIGVGKIGLLANAAPEEARHQIEVASARAMADGVIARLPRGFDQMLGKRFDEGLNLSGGEWQKIALARAYIRDAQVLVLDEPTASLDARAEYEVFERFADLMSGRMVLLISHRFSTVRMADRIVVLRDGRIVEQGSHDELVHASGLYAELFTMQAEGYR